MSIRRYVPVFLSIDDDPDDASVTVKGEPLLETILHERR
jgi:hypothetical protein